MERKNDELNAVIKAMPNGLVIYDRDGNITYINEKTKNIFSQFNVEGKQNFKDHYKQAQTFTEDGLPIALEDCPHYRCLKKGGIVKDFIMMSQRGSFSNIYISVSFLPIRNTKGEICGAVGVHEDITQRKRAEEALLESEAKYRTIFETSQEGIWVIDGNDQTVLVNDRLQQMLGYSFDELVGKSPQAYIATECKTTANERLVEHIGGMKEVKDYRLVKKDGTYLWCIISSTPRFDKSGKFDGSIGMVTDITERKKIEIEKDHYMKISEERAAWSKAIIDLMPAGVWISDYKGKVVMVNQEAVNMYSVCSSLTGSLEEYTSYKLFLPGTDEPVKFEPYPPKEAMNGVILDFERFDGTRGTQVYSTQALCDENGNIINYVAVSMDITSLTQAEKSLQKLNIVDKNKNTFINMLSHELRNPLASIMMGIDLLEKAPPGGKQAAVALSIAKRQGKLLTNLVDDLLDVTRITQNKIALKKETIEINDLIKKEVQDYQSQFFDKDVKLEVNLTTPLYIEADYSRLTQVICNLLHNATKFTDKNDVVMVSVTEDSNASEVVITVQDTGRGMNSIEQLNLFEPFIQVDKSLDRKLGGLGLGLSIVKGMVELHGGRVEAFSEGIGKGTKFTIQLPFKKVLQ